MGVRNASIGPPQRCVQRSKFRGVGRNFGVDLIKLLYAR
jgi:hypothetical protein